MTTAPRTWFPGEIVTEGLLNTEIRDQFASFFGAWTEYTPSWIAETGGTPSVGNGSLTGRYLKVGRTVNFLIKLNVGSTTTFGAANANWAFGLPSPPSSVFHGARCLTVSVRLAGLGEATGTGETSTSGGGTARAFAGGMNNAPDSTFWDQTNPMAAAAGMTFHVSGCYEASS